MFKTAKEWRDAWSGGPAEWRDKPATRNALAQFDALGGPEPDRVRALWRISRACLTAVGYDPKSDPGQMYREEMVSQKKQVANLAKAARTLANACARGDRAMMWAWPYGDNELGVKLSRPSDGKSVSAFEMQGAWFRELERRLNAEMPELHFPIIQHSKTIGNLQFDRPIKGGAPIQVESMLAFELTFYLRMFTAGRACDVLSYASTMPSDGKPCGHVVAAFCNASLGGLMSTKMVADRISKLNKNGQIRLITWPAHR